MEISVSNLSLVHSPKDWKLMAVFEVKVDLGEGSDVRISGWKYYVPEDGRLAWVEPPAVRTERGMVRPVLASPDFKADVLRGVQGTFGTTIDAWVSARRSGMEIA